MQIEVGESHQQQLDAALRELEQAQGEKDAVASDAAQQAAGLAADAENLQKLLEKTRAESEAKQQSASALRAERDTLSDELARLKAEVEELIVSHDLEVERLHMSAFQWFMCSRSSVRVPRRGSHGRLRDRRATLGPLATGAGASAGPASSPVAERGRAAAAAAAPAARGRGAGARGARHHVARRLHRASKQIPVAGAIPAVVQLLQG
jgi:ABC-type transporter Mla subunit MlaD